VAITQVEQCYVHGWARSSVVRNPCTTICRDWIVKPSCVIADAARFPDWILTIHALFDGRRVRALTVVDDYSRESLAIEVGQSITGEQVVAVMTRLAALRGVPQRIRVDNGPEFISRAVDQWATFTRSRSTSVVPAIRPATPWSSRSTAGCATSV
jgi:transposase InsO family protein